MYNYIIIGEWFMALNTFSNGLRLVCNTRADKKIACVVLHIAGGTQSEKNFQSGISDYLTKIMLMGTKKHSTREALLNYAKSNGIILTPHNSKESITISALCPKENIEKAMECLEQSEDKISGNYAFVCEKCATVFGYYGYFYYENILI